ncbi:MAG TPA: YgjP-like metallopeptidase domain-containing protein, partial [Syntrophorhabdaceae bacterium]
MKSDPGSQLSYELIRSKKRKKTLTLQIKRDGSVVLLAPERVSRAEIDRFFRDKEPWVRKKITERAENPERPGQEKKFISGETFLYHGEHYPLKIIETENGVPLSLCYGAFILRSDKSAEGRKLFMEWYRRQA